MKGPVGKAYLKQYFSKYPENLVLEEIYDFFVKFPSIGQNIESIVGAILRQAIDEVIDMPRTQRFSLDELEKTEKTYIGTKVEIIFRDTFELEKGKKLDLLVNKHEVDVKNTIRNNWTIPMEAIDEICVLLQTNDKASSFSVGLVICRDRVLNQGRNRDKKRTISISGKNEILWLVENGELPKNFFLQMDEALRQEILSPKGGSTRIANLFKNFPNEVITRRLVECVARQKDYMKRLRGNGGARDVLAREGLVILWGGNAEERSKLESLGFTGLTPDQFVCTNKD